MNLTDWESLEALGATPQPDPAVRAEWHAGRPRYAVWVARVTAPEVLDRIATVAAALGPLATPLLRSDAHLTLFVAGFPTPTATRDDDVAMDVLDQQERSLRGLSATTLQVGGVGSFQGCAFLYVSPDTALHEPRARIGESSRELRWSPYLPHLTIGLYEGGVRYAALRERLEPLAELPPIAMPLDTIELVDFDAWTPGASLCTLRRVELG
jgi:2'-5' RNA ligase